MNYAQKFTIVENAVEKYLYDNIKHTGLKPTDPEEYREHIVSTGAKIMLCKWDISAGEGGFVDAFVNNNLMGAYAKADATIIHAMYFFFLMYNNLGMPYELLNSKE